MSGGIRIGKIFGIDIKLDFSWFIVFVLVAWSLAGYYFPTVHPYWKPATYWMMGIVTALLFFASVLTHELAHSLVSRAQGVEVRDITLFIFGGAAQINEEPKRARDEFVMAIVGPLTSLLIAAFFGLVWLVSPPVSLKLHILAGWLASMNVILAVFNMIPGFPLDGGRVFRAVLWGLTNNLQAATRVATGAGRFVAYGFIFFGIWQIFKGNWASGLWIGFIGWFLENAATASYRQSTTSRMLAGHKVREVMSTDCPRVKPGVNLDELVHQVVLPSGRRCFLVVDGDGVRGLLTLHRIKEVSRDQWAGTSVEAVMVPADELKTVGPDEDLSVLIQRMTREDINQFPVMENGRLVGMVARDNVLAFLRNREELGM